VSHHRRKTHASLHSRAHREIPVMLIIIYIYFIYNMVYSQYTLGLPIYYLVACDPSQVQVP
jgi:hypothetical protein